MRSHFNPAACIGLVLSLSAWSAGAAVTTDEAAKLKTTLTPFGGEKAGNKEGTIPAWTGGMYDPGVKTPGRLPDPFAGEKPLFSITAKNMDQYADKLNEGTKAMLKRYPTFRVDVYTTHRTAAAPQFVYDNTYKNATRASLVEGAAGPQPQGAIGGVPFPIPKTGSELMWNFKLNWHWGISLVEHCKNYLVTAEGKQVLLSRLDTSIAQPYYIEGDRNPNLQFTVKAITTAPPIRAGEGTITHYDIDESKTQSWIYLTGQRRVRKLPNPCCDTPAPFAAGASTFDELSVFNGDMSRFDWTLVGKKEMYIPYNSNRVLTPTKDTDIFTGIHVNPDHVRWELHRVWVVEANLKPGQRHTSVKSRYYLDEDSYVASLGDRWDAQGQLARVLFKIPVIIPETGQIYGTVGGVYDMIRGTSYVGFVFNDESVQITPLSKPLPPATFSPDSLAGEGVR